MSTTQILFTLLLIVLLLVLAGYYAWRQVQTLRRLRSADDLPPEDRDYLRRQVRRRLAGSVLMTAFAGLLTGSFFTEGPAKELADRRQAARERNEERPLNDEERQIANWWVVYWIVLLVGVLAMLALAAYDFWATRRYGQRRYRQLQADRRDMIARQAALLRRERNGHG